MNAPLIDTKHVQRAFSRAAAQQDAAADALRQAEALLLEALDYLDDPALARQAPQRVLDFGCGTGHASRVMQARWPKAHIVSMDIALPMLQQGKRAAKRWNPFVKTPQPVCADASRLPFAEGAFDVVFSNLCLPWVEDLTGLLNGLRRVLKPQGLLLLSTLGSDTLWELRDAFAHADAMPHVSPFVDTAGLGDALITAGFFQPVVDRDALQTHMPSMQAVMQQLRAIGATNALHQRRKTLTGRGRFAAAQVAYEAFRTEQGLPVSWELISAMAWAPEAGAPIREDGMDVVAVPVARIPIRRRP